MSEEAAKANRSGAPPEARDGPSSPKVQICQSFPSAVPNFPATYPFLVPAFVPLQQEEDNNRGAGIYAVPVHPCMGAVTGFQPSGLIPITYNIPTGSNSSGVAGVEHGQVPREQQGPQRHGGIRRLRVPNQLDWFLIVKLAAVVILFNQDGSRLRLMTLLFGATFVYLHQTGALTPLLRWLRQQAAPPQPRAPVRAENDHPLGGANENSPQPGAENQNLHLDNEGRQVGNENQADAEGENGGNWWGIVWEVQMFVIGFITSLIPGFHQHND